jgi:hypothetical protein
LSGHTGRQGYLPKIGAEYKITVAGYRDGQPGVLVLASSWYRAGGLVLTRDRSWPKMTKKNLSSLKGLEVPDHRNRPRIIRKVGIEIPGYMNGPKINLGTGKGLDYWVR